MESVALSRPVQVPKLHAHRNTARIVGILFLAAFLTYGIGNGLVESAVGGPDALAGVAGGETRLTVGALLMLATSAVVAGIGMLMVPVLTAHSARTAYGYLTTRIFEAIILAVGVISLLSLVTISGATASADAPDADYLATFGALAIQENLLAYQIAMAGLGFGSMFFCYLLYRVKLVPRALALLGVVGYAIMMGSMLLELLGISVGLMPLLPGALFEVSVGVWLIVKGFSE